MTPRLVITGTRWGRPDVWAALDQWVDAFGLPRLLVLGGAHGVDRQALDWSHDRRRAGLVFPVDVVRADWARYGKAAGPIRNMQMVERAGPGDHLLAFPDALLSPGTYHCHGAGLERGLLCALIRRPDQNWLRDLVEQHQQHPRWAA